MLFSIHKHFLPCMYTQYKIYDCYKYCKLKVSVKVTVSNSLILQLLN